MKRRQKTITFKVRGDAPFPDWDQEVDEAIGAFLENCNVRNGDQIKFVLVAPGRRPTPEQKKAKAWLKKYRERHAK